MAFSHKALGYEFHFRDLKWQEEVGITGQRPLLALSLHRISDRPVTPQEAMTVLEAFPDKAIGNLFLMYQNHLPEDREWQVSIPYAPPEASRQVIQQALPREDEDE